MSRSSLSRFSVIAVIAAQQIMASFEPVMARSPVIEVHTLSSRPDAVSGGEVLVQVDAGQDAPWRAALNGQDVTDMFRPTEHRGRKVGRLTGLILGVNRLQIRIGGRVYSEITLDNHPLTGPIFSGPHLKPFVCQTEGNGLGPALDADCSAKTLVQYYYRSTQPVSEATHTPTTPTLAPGFKPYDPATPRPVDLAQTVTSDGHTVPYIVRRERGTLNRAVYEIQFLYQPSQPLPTPWSQPDSGWNGRLLYIFNPATGSVSYLQGTLGQTEVTEEPYLAQGYAVATSTLNVYGVTANDWLSAETVSMVKEHFIKEYGQPVHTISFGSSGGTVQAHLIAQDFPGLLDGLVDVTSIPDILTTVPRSSTDCVLLDAAFKGAKHPWTEAQKSAVSGFATWRTCLASMGLFGLAYIQPGACPSGLPKDQVYDAINNPQGARCDLYSPAVNLLGRDVRTGKVNRPLDNVGVQYGLVAFNAGQIDAEQFVELNERVGGYDDDGRLIVQRTEADPGAVHSAYEQGLVLTAGGGFNEVPIIDTNFAYTNDLADVHVSVWALVIRARLIAATGHADNQVILVNPRPDFLSLLAPYIPELVPYALQTEERSTQRQMKLILAMDRWLDRIDADGAPGTRSAKVVRDKPIDIADSCWTTDGTQIIEPITLNGRDRCSQLYPAYGDPRRAAGEPGTDDVLKCALKPLEPGDYQHSFSADQLRRLKVVFPSGVCDYSRPAVGEQTDVPTWQRRSVGAAAK